MEAAEIDHCGAEVRAADRDRFLTSLFAPAETRPRLYAIYAFNLELSRIAESVSEPILGEIRLQWWREAVDGIFADNPRDHGVVRALHGLKALGLCDQAQLKAMIDARTADLEEAPFASLDDLERYVTETAGGLMAAAARVLDPTIETELATVAGTVWGLSGQLRAIGYQAAQGRVTLPKDLLAAVGIDPHDLIHGHPAPGLAEVVETVHGRATALVAEVLSQRQAISKAALPALLPVALARSDLKALKRARFNPFDARLRRERLGRLLRLIWSGMSCRI